MVTHGRVTGAAHTEECRLRMGNLLARDDAGLERLRKYNLRSEEAEAPPPPPSGVEAEGAEPEPPAEPIPQEKTNMQEDSA